MLPFVATFGSSPTISTTPQISNADDARTQGQLLVFITPPFLSLPCNTESYVGDLPPRIFGLQIFRKKAAYRAVFLSLYNDRERKCPAVLNKAFPLITCPTGLFIRQSLLGPVLSEPNIRIHESVWHSCGTNNSAGRIYRNKSYMSSLDIPRY